MDRPEPPPIYKGEPVSPALIEFITNSDLKDKDKDEVLRLIDQRCDYGLKKYGQVLMSKDGRDDVIDAMQELGDLLQYAYKAKMNGRLEELKIALKSSLNVLNEILKE